MCRVFVSRCLRACVCVRVCVKEVETRTSPIGAPLPTHYSLAKVKWLAIVFVFVCVCVCLCLSLCVRSMCV